MIPMRKVIAIAAVAALLAAAGAAAAETVMIRNATLHTMGEDGVLENADVFITGGRIDRVGRDLPVPADIRVFDAEGRHVTPALFAGITGVGLTEVSAVDDSVDNEVSGLETPFMRPEFDVSLAFNPHSTLVPVARVEGLGFTLLGAAPGDSIMGGQGRIAWLDGSWDSVTGDPVLFIGVGGRAASKAGGSRAAQWMLLEQAMSEADNPPKLPTEAVLTRAGRETLKRYADGGTVVFGAHRASDLLRVIEFAERHDLRAVIAGGAEAWMVADRLAAAGVPVLLDPLHNLPGSFDMLGARLDNAALLHAAGVTIGITGAESHNARKVRQMAGNAVSHGLDHGAALAALTVNPARMFGVADRAGSLEKGKRADLVLWSGDPLEVTSVPDLVISNGRVDSMETRQTKLRDRYLVVDPEMPRAYVKP
jgi:hypothetical protein